MHLSQYWNQYDCVDNKKGLHYFNIEGTCTSKSVR